MKLSINFSLYNGTFKKTEVDILEIEKAKIVLRKSGSIFSLKDIIQYLLSFPNIKQLIIDLTHLKYNSNLLDYEDAVELLKPLEKIEDIQIMQYKFNICKKKQEIFIQQIISTQKQKVEDIEKKNGLKVVQSINRVIDLTNKNNVNKELLKQCTSNVELLDKPRVIRLFGNPSFFKGTKTLLEKFKKINTLFVQFDGQIEEKNLLEKLEGFRQMSEQINQLKHFEVLDKSLFIERHNLLIRILLEKHQNFKVTYQKSNSFLQYIPSSKYLKIHSTETNSVSQSELQEYNFQISLARNLFAILLKKKKQTSLLYITKMSCIKSSSFMYNIYLLQESNSTSNLQKAYAIILLAR
ncbi:hypothetical protein TTHERM_00826890 (macronuclear) [Tetrahymena thermophila SB210]|uniref:Uncharacterized protein n=1 Tax=Tetrahymena thermophila (strain SB210) TaxID=312017 RepID=Q22EH9_TETTS|nr:hypothetical protein TTHERM_00826890 [Tetrahymena thermophila SB210]EAR83673.2 hypothetical protein TTHERM_00826890 [Tetrahymena thermophila SB210]|eukprot:XP_001031336.2 hypothetical protein TTHERM_00826890 [Tetrahymena thermophila SB210]